MQRATLVLYAEGIGTFENKDGIVLDIELDLDDYMRWFNGEELIQNALPELTDDEREFLMTGLTGEDWDSIFETEEE